MPKTHKSKYHTRAIVTGYLEKVNAEVFDRYQKEITDERIPWGQVDKKPGEGYNEGIIKASFCRLWLSSGNLPGFLSILIQLQADFLLCWLLII